jgi:cytochrome c oxidase subunit II
MAFAVALVITLMALVITGLFVLHPWWFPRPLSLFASGVDRQFHFTLVICGTLFVLAQLALAYFAWRYRARPQRTAVRFSRGNKRLEQAWAVAITILFSVLAWTGYRAWARAAFQAPSSGALRVEVWGEQFAWYFRYPGPDGQFGPVHPSLMNDGLANYLGLDREHDLASRDDIVTTTLAVPVHKPVELILRTKDVIHSFFVRELRLKQDAMPGRITDLHFSAERTGRYEIVCAELCGLGHYRMRAELLVMSAGEFHNWLLEQARLQ